MKTISVLLILLFATIRLSAQEIVLKKPSFPSPKNELLYFLTEDSFFNPDNYNGNIKQLEKRFTEYDQIGNVLNSDTIFIESIKNYQKFKRISKQPVLDYLGIHKIKKTGKKKFDLYQFDEFNYSDVIYTLNNNKIIALTEDTTLDGTDVKYFYNQHDQLSKITYSNGYAGGVIIEAKYNDNGQIINKTSYDNADGLNVILETYTYSYNLLTDYEEKSATYFVPFYDLEENIAINEVDYKEYINDDTFYNVTSIDFTYTENQKLSEITQVQKGFSENQGEEFSTKHNFKLNYQTNQLIINANLPEKRRYVYDFDEQNNPTEIKSYVVEGDDEWLNKKTVFIINGLVYGL